MKNVTQAKRCAWAYAPVVLAAVGMGLLANPSRGSILIHDDFDDDDPTSLAVNQKGIGGGWNTAAFGGRIFGENGSDSATFGTTSFSFGGGDFANSELNSQLTNVPIFGNPPASANTVVDWRVSFAGVSQERTPAPGEQAFPGGPAADLRHEFAVISANRSNAGGTSSELFHNTHGGVYVNLFYDRAGAPTDTLLTLTGNIRVTTKNKPATADAETTAGLVTVGTFTLGTRTFGSGQDDGPDDDFFATLLLNDGGFSVSFRDDDGTPIVPTMLSGSLGISDWSSISSSRPDLSAETIAITDEFSNGVFVHALTSNLAAGRGAGDLGSITVSQVPEPGMMGLAGVAAALLLARRGRAAKGR